MTILMGEGGVVDGMEDEKTTVVFKVFAPVRLPV
jgi:hypothetical protein